jgi:hypothetical protein
MRIVIGAVLVALVSTAVFVWTPYQGELRIAQKIESLDGEVHFGYMGPDWIPQSMQAGLPFLWRIDGVIVSSDSEPLFAEIALAGIQAINLRGPDFTDAGVQHMRRLTQATCLSFGNTKVTDVGLKQLIGLPRLRFVHLDGSNVTDSGLEHFKGLANLEFLGLSGTHVTDAGLEHFKGLKNLKWLNLGGTKTTSEGRAMLRGALPNCRIDPWP